MKMAERVARSKAALTEAVLDLLHEGQAGKITITQVCRRANVTRPTFYQHYDSVDDLVSHAVTDRLRAHQDTAFAMDPGSPQFDAALARLLDLVWADRRLVEVLHTSAAGTTLSHRTSVDVIAASILARMPQPVTPQVELRARFTAAGTTELLASWLATDHPEELRDTYVALLQDLAHAVMTE